MTIIGDGAVIKSKTCSIFLLYFSLVKFKVGVMWTPIGAIRLEY